MARFPKVERLCPYKGDIASVMDGDTCTLCKRPVFDLGAMADADRALFLNGCRGEICVTYRLPAAVAAAAFAVMLPSVAAAQIDTVVVTGGIEDAAHAHYVQTDAPADKKTPALPVVYDDKPAAKDAKPSAKPSPAAP
jgi:hypothetical protein